MITEWTLYSRATHPFVSKKVVENILHLCEKNKKKKVSALIVLSFSLSLSLSFFLMCIARGMRLFSISWLESDQAISSTLIQGIEISPPFIACIGRHRRNSILFFLPHRPIFIRELILTYLKRIYLPAPNFLVTYFTTWCRLCHYECLFNRSWAQNMKQRARTVGLSFKVASSLFRYHSTPDTWPSATPCSWAPTPSQCGPSASSSSFGPLESSTHYHGWFLQRYEILCSVFL